MGSFKYFCFEFLGKTLPKLRANKVSRLLSEGMRSWNEIGPHIVKAHSLFILLSLLAIGSARAETFKAKVIGVADGDTLTVLDTRDGAKTQVKIRLQGGPTMSLFHAPQIERDKKPVSAKSDRRIRMFGKRRRTTYVNKKDTSAQHSQQFGENG